MGGGQQLIGWQAVSVSAHSILILNLGNASTELGLDPSICTSRGANFTQVFPRSLADAINSSFGGHSLQHEAGTLSGNCSLTAPAYSTTLVRASASVPKNAVDPSD